MRKNFVVYKSSAGSGKTTTLVKEYLKICLKNPSNFRHVLAITFTNKAANEMKTKILSSLQDFVTGNLSHPMSLQISRETGLSVDQIQLNAEKLLSLIIHHYDEFAVSTIDSFVHQIVRSFASDLHLPQGFDVIIDQEDMVPFVLDDLYDKLGNDESLTRILLQFVLSNVDDEKTYNLDQSLIAFIEKQLNEDGFTESRELAHLHSVDFLKIIEKLRLGGITKKSQIMAKAVDALKIMDDRGINVSDFFHKGSGVGGYFQKLTKWRNKISELFPNSYVNKAIEDNIWYGKGISPDTQSRIDAIAPLLREHLLEIIKLLREYVAEILVYRNIYQVALIQEIRVLLNDFTEKTGAVHISEFNKRIYEEIAGQPVPFIYERIGHRYRYFLVDEFQDTSVLQWNNLLPLIEESLASGHFNMLVGDAKQAIYRFRSGEVELFTHLPKLYGQADTHENRMREQVVANNYHEEKLTVNYRSREEIIRFNNDFFTDAASALDDHFRSVYDDHIQELPQQKKAGGQVKIEFLGAESIDDFNEKKKTKILNWIEELKARQYPLRDICVLTRTNGDGGDIAAFLLNHGYPVVSSDSLKLIVSVEVRLVVAFMRCLLEPDNQLYWMELISRFHELKSPSFDLNTLFHKMMGRADLFDWFSDISGVNFPSLLLLRTRTVLEIAEEVIRLLIKPEQPNIFLQYFLDFVFEKQNIYKGSLTGFLKLWDEKKDKLNIIMPESLDAIRVMTVHKAKGLKFGIVITDMAMRRQKRTRNSFWSEIPFGQFPELPKALFSMNKDLEYIGQKEVLDYEIAKTKLDFLNLIYVAFTRAVDGLFVTGSFINEMPDLFSTYLIHFLNTKGLWEDSKHQYVFGQFPIDIKESHIPETKSVDLQLNTTVPWYEHLLVAPEEEVYWEMMGGEASKTYGNIIHHILAKIREQEDVEQEVSAFYYAGILDENEAGQVKRLLIKVLSHPEVSPYFRKDIVIKSETEMLDNEEKGFLRADRVVLFDNKLVIIDYKTGEQKSSHRKQLEEYAAVFSRMGYKEIEKKLIYLLPEVQVISF